MNWVHSNVFSSIVFAPEAPKKIKLSDKRVREPNFECVRWILFMFCSRKKRKETKYKQFICDRADINSFSDPHATDLDSFNMLARWLCTVFFRRRLVKFINDEISVSVCAKDLNNGLILSLVSGHKQWPIIYEMLKWSTTKCR